MIASPSHRLPNFFLAGAPKCGTTSLYHYLAQHPQVFMSAIKEPGFFGFADLMSHPLLLPAIERDRAALSAFLAGPQLGHPAYFVTTRDDYLALFRDAGDRKAVGEASVNYLRMPSAAGAIHSAIPEARLLFVLRDPADRAFSLYLLDLNQDPTLSFRRWFETRIQAPRDHWEPLPAANYATHLRRFFDFFPRERIQVHLYEDFRRDPARMLRQIFNFLEVDPTFPVDFSVRHRVSAAPRSLGLHALRLRLFGDRSFTRVLPNAVARRIRGLYRSGRSDHEMTSEDRRMVVEHYAHEIERAAALTGRDLSAWLR